MNKLICKKCGNKISNEFGVTLSYCTECGENLINLRRKPKNNLALILIISFLTASVLGGLLLFFNLSAIFQKKSVDNSTPSIKIPSSIAASEITEVTYQSRSHFGPVVGSDESYTSLNLLTLSKDGTAQKITNRISYDTGKKQGSGGTQQKGTFPKEQFEKLAQILVENDFSNAEDGFDERSNMRRNTLIIKYSGKTKEIVVGNTRNSAQVDAIMSAILAFPTINFEN